MLCALIMAGGKGTRFWPVSTEEKPKQFLNLVSDDTMLQMTVNRLRSFLPIENIFIVTSLQYKDIVQNQISDLPFSNIIIEPIGRNTAPCILLSSIYINQIYSNATIAVLPSDHVIVNNDKFEMNLNEADNFIQKNDGIMTIGITPNRPETGFGYINYNELIDNNVYSVNSFKEKPSFETALEYIENGKYLWNAGMFVFNSAYMIEQFKKLSSDIYNNLNQLPKITDSNYYNVLNEVYPNCESISIDYAIMEKTNQIYIVKADFLWDDLGSWRSVERYLNKDSNNNLIKGNVVTYNCDNNIIYSTKESNNKIILVEMSDSFFIQTDDITIVGSRDKIEEVHKFKEKS